jgi:hypothetical protein
MSRIEKQTSRRPAPTGTYPFERVHFDVIILGIKGKKGHGGSTCIPHFWCDYTKYHRAWPTPNHKQATLLPIFESIIAFAKKFGPGIKWIHSDDEGGIGQHIEDLFEQDGIIWEVSPPYTEYARPKRASRAFWKNDYGSREGNTRRGPHAH